MPYFGVFGGTVALSGGLVVMPHKSRWLNTTNFFPHQAKLSTSLPSNTEKHSVERFKLSNDGKHMLYSGTMNDPENLSESAQLSTRLDYSTELKHSDEERDLKIARRFL